MCFLGRSARHGRGCPGGPGGQEGPSQPAPGMSVSFASFYKESVLIYWIILKHRKRDSQEPQYMARIVILFSVFPSLWFAELC